MKNIKVIEKTIEVLECTWLYNELLSNFVLRIKLKALDWWTCQIKSDLKIKYCTRLVFKFSLVTYFSHKKKNRENLDY